MKPGELGVPKELKEFVEPVVSIEPGELKGEFGNPRSPVSRGRFWSLGSWAASVPASASHGAPAGGRRPPAIGWDNEISEI